MGKGIVLICPDSRKAVYERPLVARRTYLCLGMVRPGLVLALGSDFRARCEMGLEIKQRPMDDLGLCALGLILIKPSNAF